MWERHFGFVQQLTGSPLIIGETGGTATGLDAVWAKTAINYFVKKNFAGVFWFCARRQPIRAQSARPMLCPAHSTHAKQHTCVPQRPRNRYVFPRNRHELTSCGTAFETIDPVETTLQHKYRLRVRRSSQPTELWAWRKGE